MTSTQETPWLTVPRAATHACRHPGTLRVALETGELHGHQRIRGGRWQIHINSLEAWIQGERNTTSPCGCTQLANKRRRASRSPL